MSDQPSPFIYLPDTPAETRPQWEVEVTKSPTSDEFIASIQTPQKPFEFRHVDRGYACQKVTELVREAEDRGEVLPHIHSI